MFLPYFTIETGTVVNGQWRFGGLATSGLGEDREIGMLLLRGALRICRYRLHHGDHVRLLRDGVEVLRLPIDAAFWTDDQLLMAA